VDGCKIFIYHKTNLWNLAAVLTVCAAAWAGSGGGGGGGQRAPYTPSLSAGNGFLHGIRKQFWKR